MLSAEEFCRRLKVRLTPRERNACAYLESHDQRFLIDFGYANAIEKAVAHARSQRKRRRGKE